MLNESDSNCRDCNFSWQRLKMAKVIIIIIIIIIISIIIIELTHSKTLQENTVEIEPQP